MTSKAFPLRRLSRFLNPSSTPSSIHTPSSSSSHGALFLLKLASESLFISKNGYVPSHSSAFRSFCTHSLNLEGNSLGPAAVDYRSLLQEDEFHRLANSTIHSLLDKLEEYGDAVQIDGFDIDYGNEVLTLKLGNLGTYVLNKQTPNRQLWLSSPVSGPSRFDWDQNTNSWVYRRSKENLIELLQSELEKLCGESIDLSLTVEKVQKF